MPDFEENSPEAPPVPETLPEDFAAPSEMQEDALSQDESKASAFIRRAVRWLAGVFIIFALGALAGFLAFAQPKSDELQQTNAQLTQANTDIAALETQITDLETEIEAILALKTTNQELQDDQQATHLHIHILSALADVYAAQYALATGDVSKAQIQLTNTPDKLDMLSETIASNQQASVESMQQRLQLALSEMEDDIFAAQSDLEVLANNLVLMENSFFTVP